MEFYIFGAVFMVLGMGIKALAAKLRWIGVPRTRRTVSDIVVISLGAAIYLFSMVIFVLFVGLYDAVGLTLNSAAWAGWFSTLFLVVVFCTWLGWKIGSGPTPRARMPHAFAENPDNPFGAPDGTSHDFDFNATDSEKP